ncbi:hypothetical protein JGS22_023540 [Streptomyces sp. P38-E01]|uniref:Restriction endonuclease n=1 Tax=Streptomyces tardus TaxID=2780544 RepID=A0A949JUV1_9ACTN|nr:hypothetical protein [Streptomyces tardus]MBU7600520.1 hypothetical protein [Streptomyces tardus]
MTENVPVRCPDCRREHAYAPPHYPCACGAPVGLDIHAEAEPKPIRRRTWSDSWVRVRCVECGRQQDWPAPELGCSCGTLLRLPLRSEEPSRTPDSPAGTPDACTEQSAHRPEGGRGEPRGKAAERRTAQGREQPQEPWRDQEFSRAQPGAGTEEPGPVVGRPAFRPVTIRTARDAVVTAGRYVRWLGFEDVRTSETRPASGVDLRGPGIVARVDPTTTPTSLRAVETLWLNGLNESALPICFSLAGYARDARARADSLDMPLFVLDLTGAPQPVNTAADELIAEQD